MTGVAFSYGVACGPDRVRELMLDEAFLHAFVAKQHATEKKITVDRDREVSTLSWSIRLDGELPGIVTRFVGHTADLHLAFDLCNSKLEMTAKAKRLGTLTCDFTVEGAEDGVTSGVAGVGGVNLGSGSVLHIEGRVSVSGPFGGMAETTVRDQVIEPVFREDLVPLLSEWCMRRHGESDATPA